MNRCIPSGTLRATPSFLLRHRCAVFASLLAMLALSSTLPVQAQTPLPQTPLTTARPIPATAQLAVMQVLQPPVILLNGQQERLSPGARIRDANNMLALSGTLIGRNLRVAFVREPLGLIHEVWILNEAELQRVGTQYSNP
jgi:hypothetical protein